MGGGAGGGVKCWFRFVFLGGRGGDFLRFPVLPHSIIPVT